MAQRHHPVPTGVDPEPAGPRSPLRPSGLYAARFAPASGSPAVVDFSMAFQAIVDVAERRVIGHEALVRGACGEPYGQIGRFVADADRAAFDRVAHAHAIRLAMTLETAGSLSLNLPPQRGDIPAIIDSTAAAAERYGFPADRIYLEVNQGEPIVDGPFMRAIGAQAAKAGLRVSVNVFGAMCAGLTLLAEYQPDLLKLDMRLVRGVDRDVVRRKLAQVTTRLADDLDIPVVAEGVETPEEYAALRACGVRAFQGYHIGFPRFEWMQTAAEIDFDRLEHARLAPAEPSPPPLLAHPAPRPLV